jgi:hypothetical protein
LISANLLNTAPYRIAAVLTPSGYNSTLPVSVVDTPGAGTFYYSLWTYASLAGISAENVVLTVLQVSP